MYTTGICYQLAGAIKNTCILQNLLSMPKFLTSVICTLLLCTTANSQINESTRIKTYIVSADISADCFCQEQSKTLILHYSLCGERYNKQVRDSIFNARYNHVRLALTYGCVKMQVIIERVGFMSWLRGCKSRSYWIEALYEKSIK